MTDLALGLRMAAGGGRSGVARLLLVGAGMGFGVAMLLLVASLPSVLDARQARTDARAVSAVDVEGPGPRTLLTEVVRSGFRAQDIEGRLLQPEGEVVPLPPGVDRVLAPGEVLLSPALARLMDSPDGEALRGRWGDRVVGTIGPEGLAGPQELRFYLGTDSLSDATATRVDGFGASPRPADRDMTVVFLGLVGLTVFLVPVMAFIAAAVRFGGEARDRRLAAVRLVGADVATARRVAAGETLGGALAGLVLGSVLFVAVGPAAAALVPPALSFYPADLRPVPLLGAAIVVLVPLAAVLVTTSAMRRVLVEPLGVVRRATVTRRRLWWRLVLPVLGLGLLHPLLGDMGEDSGQHLMVLLGVAALLVGVAVLLPWLVEVVVRRLGPGAVSWELAVRRLQVDNGSAVRAVSAIVVSVAGLIALQGLLASLTSMMESDQGERTGVFQAEVYGVPSVSAAGPWDEVLASTPGVTGAALSSSTVAESPETGERIGVWIGSCEVLEHVAGPPASAGCAEGDAVLVSPSGAAVPEPGTRFALGDVAQDAALWEMPSDVRRVEPPVDPVATGSTGPESAWLFLTPSAVGDAEVEAYSSVLAALDARDPDAVDRLRTAVAGIRPTAYVADFRQQSLAGGLAVVREALTAVTVALLVMIGASLLVNVVEQLRERRRLLAVLAAFGVRRRTLAGSVLWQVAIPVLLGLAIAVCVGTGLGLALQRATGSDVGVDLGAVGVTAGAAALVVLATVAASLPLLVSLTRPGGLRAE